MKIAKETTEAPFDHGRLYILCCLCGVVLITILQIFCFGIEAGYAEPVFSVASTDEPLYEVLVKISKETCYQIEIPKNWKNVSITANLDNLTLEEGIREIIRLIGSPNYAMTINDSMKMVDIKIFDAYSGYPPVASKSLAELQQKQTGAAPPPVAVSMGKNKGTDVDAGTRSGFLDKKDLPLFVERKEDIAEGALIEMEINIQQEASLGIVIVPPD